MDNFSASLMIKALDGLSQRAEAVASNIANASTAGYRPIKVSFEDALKRAAGSGINALRSVEPQKSRVIDPLTGVGVRLDGELATGTTTASRYEALVEILSRRLEIEGTALGGGA